MATSETLSKKQMKRLESRKSHSWWWDSHISPKNSKWLAENLESMDKSVKRMLKLIEEDGDSFAKKAEMYYQKRPELIFLVEEFYRMYRSLAERYDHVTGELRKNIPCDLQSQGSGISGSEIGSEQSSALPSPRKHRKSSNRAAGFDFFLGAKEGYDMSTSSDSSSESDDSSVNNDSGFPENINEHHTDSKKIMELEIELRELKEKLWMLEEEHSEKGARNENIEDIHAKIKVYEQELRTLNEKLRLSEKEVSVLKIELDRLRSLEPANLQAAVEFSSTNEDTKTSELYQPDSKIKSLEEELRVTKEKLEESKMQIASLEFEAIQSSERIQKLEDEVCLACKDITAWKTKFNSEKKDNSKLLERLASIKLNLLDRDHEIMDLKSAVSDTEQKIFPEKAQLKAEISKLMEKQTHLEDRIREYECSHRSFEEEIGKINCEKAEMEKAMKGEIEKLRKKIKDLNAEVKSRDDKVEQLVWHLNQLHMEHVKLIGGMEEAEKQLEEMKLRGKELEEEVERQRREILEGAEEKREAIRQLCLSLEHYRNDYDRLRQDYIGRKQRVSVLAA